MTRITFGSIETVTFPDYNHVEVIAKVDTGAWTGALHCTDIQESNNELSFKLLGESERFVARGEYEKRTVKSASGHTHDRYIIPICIAIKGKTYHTTVGLTDRSTMQREMLLGRKFLIENNVLVDVLLTINEDHEAEKFL